MHNIFNSLGNSNFILIYFPLIFLSFRLWKPFIIVIIYRVIQNNNFNELFIVYIISKNYLNRNENFIFP